MKFCPECGAKLVSQKFCQECGTNITKYLNGSSDSSANTDNIVNFDFSNLEQEARVQLDEQERLEKLAADFEIENGVLVKYKGKGGKVVIPKEVTIIGTNAFMNNEKITEVVIEDGVVEIGYAAFCDTKNLKKISLPKSLRNLAGMAFVRSAIERIVIPKGIKELSNGVFAGCAMLKQVDLPDGLEIIGDEAFSSTQKLLALFIPKSVKTISENAFVYSIITDLYFEAGTQPSITKVHHSNFEEICAKMHYTCDRDSVIIPDYDQEAKKYGTDLTNYNKSEFYDKFGKIHVKPGVEIVRVPYGVRSFDNYQADEIDKISTIMLPPTTTRLEAKFNLYGNSRLDTVYAEGVTFIGDDAFYECKKLKSFYGKSMTVIESSAFAYCTSLVNFEFPQNLRKLGSYAFLEVPAFKKIKIPSTLEIIETSAFRDCPNLESVEIEHGVREIGKNAFGGCLKLKNVTIPPTVEKIASRAFSGCENLESLEIPEGVKKLGTAAFQNCKSLKTIKIPYSMETMDTSEMDVSYKSFHGCDSLKFVYLPRGRKEAYMPAFDYWKDDLAFIEY